MRKTLQLDLDFFLQKRQEIENEAANLAQAAGSDSEGLNPDTYSSVFVCVHKYDSELPLDSGTEEDLEKIIQDLQDNKFKPIVCRSN